MYCSYITFALYEDRGSAAHYLSMFRGKTILNGFYDIALIKDGYEKTNFNGLVQDCGISITNAKEGV